jgi:hypothetical protein
MRSSTTRPIRIAIVVHASDAGGLVAGRSAVSGDFGGADDDGAEAGGVRDCECGRGRLGLMRAAYRVNDCSNN